MPDHVHLLAAVPSPKAARTSFARIIAGLGRRCGQSWQPVPPAALVTDTAKTARVMRYVLLNPCREGIACDPLAWRWSTHRDVVGAAAPAWVTAESLAAVLGCRTRGFREWVHRYVSSDPSVAVTGTPLPDRPRIDQPVVASLTRIQFAAAAATRAAPDALTRRTPARHAFVLLARALGMRDTLPLARLCKITPRAIQKLAHKPAPHLTAAALLCLTDARLLACTRSRGRSSPFANFRAG